MNEQGILYIVSTPIGNLEDITLRALRILKEVDIIACEDTLHTQKLLNYYDIKKQTISYHSHNQKTRTFQLLDLIFSGKNIALVSDAGTPGISDPGYEIIKEAIPKGVKVVPIPGVTALITGLIISGFSTNKFVYEGFLSSKQQARRKELDKIKSEVKTVILYEAPHRIKDLLSDMHEILGDRDMVLCRELTKMYEEISRGKILDVLSHIPEKIKGELTVIIKGQEFNDTISLSEDKIKEELEKIIKEQNKTKNEAVKELAQLTGMSRNEIYKISLKI